MEVESGIRGDNFKWRELSEMKKTITIVACALILLSFGLLYLLVLTNDAPQRQVQFSVVDLSASGLNVNATSSPVFHIIFRLDPTSESGLRTCLTQISTNISYSGDLLAKSFDKPHYVLLSDPCYDMLYWNEFVTRVTGSNVTLPKNLQESLVNGKEVKLDIEMEFVAEVLPSNYYHVLCKNVPIKDMDVPMPCRVTMKVNLV